MLHILQVLALWWGYLRVYASATEMRMEMVSDLDGTTLLDSFVLRKPPAWGAAYKQRQF